MFCEKFRAKRCDNLNSSILDHIRSISFEELFSVSEEIDIERKEILILRELESMNDQ